jgi:type II secretory pathway pseudopilin PulG
MPKANSRSAFTLVEMVGIVALLAILTAGAVVGLKHQRENTELGKVLQCLSAVDQAKQTWLLFHPHDTWPTIEASRWAAIRGYLNSKALIMGTASLDSYNSYDSFLPTPNYKLWIKDVNEPCRGQSVEGVTIVRPL